MYVQKVGNESICQLCTFLDVGQVGRTSQFSTWITEDVIGSTGCVAPMLLDIEGFAVAAVLCVVTFVWLLLQSRCMRNCVRIICGSACMEDILLVINMHMLQWCALCAASVFFLALCFNAPQSMSSVNFTALRQTTGQWSNLVVVGLFIFGTWLCVVSVLMMQCHASYNLSTHDERNMLTSFTHLSIIFSFLWLLLLGISHAAFIHTSIPLRDGAGDTIFFVSPRPHYRQDVFFCSLVICIVVFILVMSVKYMDLHLCILRMFVRGCTTIVRLAAVSQLPIKNTMNICAVCLEHPADVLFHPCSHLAVCQTCSTSLTQCCICRRLITSMETIFLAGAADPDATADPANSSPPPSSNSI